MSDELTLTNSDILNTDGTVTRLLCPTCKTPVRKRVQLPDAPYANRGFLCENGACTDPDRVVYRPHVARFAIPLHHGDKAQFIAAIAAMNYDGEDLPDGEDFVMENDDAVATLARLILDARELAK